MNIVVLPFNEIDKARAERLCDLIFWLSGRNPQGHCLLVSAPDVHTEFRLKVRLAAEVAFESVELMELAPAGELTKPQAINRAFKVAAKYISETYKDPFLWLEADCVPMTQFWLSELFNAYHAQPKRYMGVHSDKYLSRVAIYPPDAIKDIDPHLNVDIPFDKSVMLSRKAKNSPLIHIGQQPIPETVALFNGDRTGLLVESLIEKASTQIPSPQPDFTPPTPSDPALNQAERRKPGRPKKIIA